MSSRTLPILFINLGGEMLYVLDQRLKVQNVSPERGGKVLNDIISTMFNRKFIDDIFTKHQPLYSRGVMKTIFDKLAHASIMRLNSASMDKLYDLMVMAVKHQMVMCRNPFHIISVTLNHLDAILGLCNSIQVKQNVENAFQHVVKNYSVMTVYEIQSVRHGILDFFQDYNIRVSVFLQEGVQHSDGKFVIHPSTTLFSGVEQPGSVRFMDGTGEIRLTEKFSPGERYVTEEDSLGLSVGDIRPTFLGSNMYQGRYGSLDTELEGMNHSQEASKEKRNVVAIENSTTSSGPAVCNEKYGSQSKELAKEELNLLAKLIGTNKAKTNTETFKLNLFGSEDDCGSESAEQKVEANEKVLRIDLKSQSRDREDLDKIIKEMSVEERGAEEDDILDLMDKAG